MDRQDIDGTLFLTDFLGEQIERSTYVSGNFLFCSVDEWLHDFIFNLKQGVEQDFLDSELGKTLEQNLEQAAFPFLPPVQIKKRYGYECEVYDSDDNDASNEDELEEASHDTELQRYLNSETGEDGVFAAFAILQEAVDTARGGVNCPEEFWNYARRNLKARLTYKRAKFLLSCKYHNIFTMMDNEDTYNNRLRYLDELKALHEAVAALYQHANPQIKFSHLFITSSLELLYSDFKNFFAYETVLGFGMY